MRGTACEWVELKEHVSWGRCLEWLLPAGQRCHLACGPGPWFCSFSWGFGEKRRGTARNGVSVLLLSEAPHCPIQSRPPHRAWWHSGQQVTPPTTGLTQFVLSCSEPPSEGRSRDVPLTLVSGAAPLQPQVARGERVADPASKGAGPWGLLLTGTLRPS